MSRRFGSSAKEYAIQSASIARMEAIELANKAAQSIGLSPFFAPKIYEQWSQILLRSSRTIAQLKQPTNGRILFFPVWGPTTAIATKAIEVVLSHSMRMRGVDSRIVSCHRALPACLIDPLGNHQLEPHADYPASSTLASTCRHCVRSMEKLYARSLTPLIKMSDHESASSLRDTVALVDRLSTREYADFVYDGVSVGQHALASAYRVTGRGTLLDTPYHQWVHKHQLIGAICVQRTTKSILQQYKPDCIALTHGIYVDHGTIAETARSMGVPVTVFVRPYRRDTVMLCHNDTYHRALVDEPVSLWHGIEMTSKRREKLSNYVDSRRTGVLDSITYHPNPIEGRDKILKVLGIDSSRPIVSLYTNVLWDAQIYHACNAFPNMLEWLYETVAYFANRPDLQLVVRVHPAEVKARIQSQQPVVKEIAHRFPTLPENVAVVPPESDVSSYDLAEASCAAIVFGTKMGLEIALRRIPVIVAGESFVRGKGFTYDASSADEYFSILDDIPNLPRMSDESMEMAKRYAFHFYFRRQIDFELYSEDAVRGGGQFMFDTLDGLQDGANKNLDLICDGLLNRQEILSYS